MGPKPDPDEIKYSKWSFFSQLIVYLKVVGGEVTSAAILAPKCSPLGLPPKKVGEDIQKATSKWKGVKIQIEIAVQNRQCTVKMLPTATPLLIEALKKTGRDRKKQKEWKYDGNLSFDQVLKVAEQMREAKKSLAKEFSGTVKEVLGTCVSLGCTVEKQSPKDIQQQIDAGERKCWANWASNEASLVTILMIVFFWVIAELSHNFAIMLDLESLW